ncbi:methyltransferase regulatory domain-containing protein [Hydromonas duriensis]|uniref:Methyltransferase-like protein n=1 Tax=Hydromonas duriensis TaxID=1527608 RepID=A0A4R6Y8L3_9BURK|nr:class I SAM-dependent methyltransferase [Hydromonas duriensis]TDR31721.1 methyltransferase-like protein [Hydromonas duriensis]
MTQFDTPASEATQSHSGISEMPEQSHPFPTTHPAHLAAIAELSNIQAPDVYTARVLELGCAAGGNIIPLSFYYPNMTLVGVDNSKTHIEKGQRIIREMGLTNVQLHCMNIADITPSLGQFDYIIVHGVYSWVPPEIQDQILRVVQENLSEHGVAFISYNVYPGWKIHEISRDAMQFHARYAETIEEQVQQGRDFMQFLNSLAPKDSMYKNMFEKEAQRAKAADSDYIAHEYFEENNLPCYFIDFINHAHANNLTYLGDSNFISMFAHEFSLDTQELLHKASNDQQLELEQYLDFIKNRSFRQTLLCHAPQVERIQRDISESKLQRICYNCEVEIEEQTNEFGATHYALPQQSRKVMQKPIQQAVLKALRANRLNFLSYEQLQTCVKNNLGLNDDTVHFDNSELNECLIQLIFTGYIPPLTQMPQLNHQQTVPSHPQVNPLAMRYALLTGQLVSSQHTSKQTRHDLVLSTLLPLLDGQHSEEELAQHLTQAVLAGHMTFIASDTQQAVSDEHFIAHEARMYTRTALEQLCREGHLISAKS